MAMRATPRVMCTNLVTSVDVHNASGHTIGSNAAFRVQIVVKHLCLALKVFSTSDTISIAKMPSLLSIDPSHATDTAMGVSERLFDISCTLVSMPLPHGKDRPPSELRLSDCPHQRS